MLAFTTQASTAVGSITYCVQTAQPYCGPSRLSAHKASAKTGILSPNYLKKKAFYCCTVLSQTQVQSTVLYNSEIWTIKDHKRKLTTFEMAVLSKTCGITRRDRRRNMDILKELQMEKDINDTPFDLLWACDSHGKGQMSTYLATWIHTWTTD